MRVLHAVAQPVPSAAAATQRRRWSRQDRSDAAAQPAIMPETFAAATAPESTHGSTAFTPSLYVLLTCTDEAFGRRRIPACGDTCGNYGCGCGRPIRGSRASRHTALTSVLHHRLAQERRGGVWALRDSHFSGRSFSRILRLGLRPRACAPRLVQVRAYQSDELFGSLTLSGQRTGQLAEGPLVEHRRVGEGLAQIR